MRYGQQIWYYIIASMAGVDIRLHTKDKVQWCENMSHNELGDGDVSLVVTWPSSKLASVAE